MSLFRIYVDGALFYHPQMSKLAITAARIEEDAENIDSMTLSAPYNHPYLSAIRPLASTIVCKKGNAIVFEGRALDKQCSSRNIREIRARALRQIRAKIKRREGYGRPGVVIIILLFMLLIGVPLVCLGERLWVMYPWLEPVAAVLSALVMAVMFQDSFRREAESLLRQHWASLNGLQRKE